MFSFLFDYWLVDGVEGVVFFMLVVGFLEDLGWVMFFV